MNLAVSIAAIEGAAAPILMAFVRVLFKQVLEKVTAAQTKTLLETVDKIVTEKLEHHIRDNHNGRT